MQHRLVNVKALDAVEVTAGTLPVRHQGTIVDGAEPHPETDPERRGESHPIIV